MRGNGLRRARHLLLAVVLVLAGPLVVHADASGPRPVKV